MIITSSRAISTKCWTNAFNLYHRNIEGGTAAALVDGGAVHKAIAHGLATRNWEKALEKARPDFEAGIDRTSVMPDDLEKIEAHWGVVEAATKVFEEETADAEYEVIQPECIINVEIPNSMHNCVWMHWRDRLHGNQHWSTPPADMIERGLVAPAHDAPERDCACWTPHRLVGQTDAIVVWERNVWLNEYKTTTFTGDNFWSQWDLDLQPSLYIYGVSKALGVPVRGTIIHALYRPSERQVEAWNARRKYGPPKSQTDYIGYERRAITRTKEQLDYAIDSLHKLCTEWEWRIVTGNFRPALARGVCNEYNRLCQFNLACLNPTDSDRFDDFVPRHRRYDDDIFDKVVQIQTASTTRRK